jgi:hypothetical protein
MADLVQTLVEHVTAGELLDLAPDEDVSEAAMRSWGVERTIPAAAVRDILRGRLAPDPDPLGLRLRGARIMGRLNLENLATQVPLELFHCLLTEGIVARDATLPFLTLSGSVLDHPSEPALDAARLTTTFLFLDGTTIRSDTTVGAVSLTDARISGPLDCTGAKLHNAKGPALEAGDLHADQSVFLRDGFEAVSAAAEGAVHLVGARIGSQLNCDNATLRNTGGPALVADDLHTEQGLYLRGVEAVGDHAAGTVRLPGAWVGGLLDCGGAKLRNTQGPALIAWGLQAAQDVSLRDVEAVGDSAEDGAVSLVGARIGGHLNCSGAKLRNTEGPALAATALHVDQGVDLTGGFEATNAGDADTIGLSIAHIGGNLDCGGAKLRNDRGPALTADGLHVGQGVFLSDGFEAVGNGELGAVRLVAATIRVTLECDGANLHNADGPALEAQRLQVEQSVFLRDGFRAEGHGSRGAVVLLGARIGGQLDCDGATLHNTGGSALIADSIQVGQDVYLGNGFEAKGGGPHVTVDLTAARLAGGLFLDPARLSHRDDPTRRLSVDRLEYAALPQMPRGRWRIWLGLLRDATPAYAAQPYQHLAAAHRAAGHDRDARAVLIAQRRDQLRRATPHAGERAWGLLTGITLGYGYQPWRALVGLLASVCLAVLLAVVLGSHGGLGQVGAEGRPGAARCTAIDHIGVGLDFGLPLIKTGSRTNCDTTPSTTGQALTVTSWTLQTCSWAFATLFIAGFTSAVRKT